MILEDNWSDLRQFREMPDIDHQRMHDYRQQRIKDEMRKHDVAVLVMVSPMSMRYAINYRSYGIFMAHVPSTYMFMSLEAPYRMHNELNPTLERRHKGQGKPLSHFYGGSDLEYFAGQFASDVDDYLAEAGSSNRRVAVEYVNPSITKALLTRGIDVIDGVLIVEEARVIKSADEINCIRWSIAVAEHGATIMKNLLKPGITETQLWGVLNYANLANDGDWHEGRMLASGPRTNPWLQEATQRQIESGDLVGFDTDMVGPFGYCADLSRTFHCGPARPTTRQKQLYRLAVDEIEHNLKLVKAGNSFSLIQKRAYPIPEEFRERAYVCMLHGVGMCDEYPHLVQGYRKPIEFDNVLQAGMVVCVESFMGAVGDREGVKLEQQVLVTDAGYELLTTMPFEADLIE
ncbi:MAG: aminopeptidase P family protein [Gammaproteobacteria bacterium]|nr:aminopeptidase P family protein [Gammaproteobacteria bacterium]